MVTVKALNKVNMLIMLIVIGMGAVEPSMAQFSMHGTLNFPKANVKANYQFNREPNLNQEITLDLQFTSLVDPTQPTDLPNFPAVTLWMPQHQHGSAPTRIQRTGMGRYHITNLRFIMAGSWEVRIDIFDQTGHHLERQVIPIEIKGRQSHRH